MSTKKYFLNRYFVETTEQSESTPGFSVAKPKYVQRTPTRGGSNTAVPCTTLDFSAIYDGSIARSGELRIENDDQRMALLQFLISRPDSMYDLDNRYIKLALAPDEWRALAAEVRRSTIPMPNRIRSAFKPYTASLRLADRLWAQAERLARSTSRFRLFRQSDRKSRFREAEGEYCHALEILEELISMEPGIITWLDRPARFSHYDHHSPDPSDVPRLITSSSQYSLRQSSTKQDKRDLTLRTLKSSLARLDASAAGPQGALLPLDDDGLDLPGRNDSANTDYSDLDFDE